MKTNNVYDQTTKVFSVISLILLLSPCCFAQRDEFNRIDTLLMELNEKKEFNGSILIAKNDYIIYQKNIGLADMEYGVPVNSSTKFELASVSKTFTALLVMQLVEKGKIDLDAKVTSYIPEFTGPGSNDIKIHHLLSHTSGIQDFVGLNCDFSNWIEKEFMAGLSKTPVNFQAGSKFEYASSTYILLRFIIERVTGFSYEHNLQEHVLKVAEMHDTGVLHNREIIPNRAMGYVSAGEKYQNALPVLNHEIFLGAASIYSTAQDLLKFDRALYGNKLLGSKLKERMFTVVQRPYAYGWFVSEDATAGKILSHGGDIFGFTTLIERRLKDKTLIIILSNLQSVDREKIIRLFDKIL